MGAWTVDGIFLDEGSLGSKSSICTEGSLLEARGVDWASWGLDDLCFFSLPRLLGRSPKLTLDNICFSFFAC